MASHVRADSLRVGDVVVLPSAQGSSVRRIRIHRVTPRRATIKFEGRTTGNALQETRWSWGWPPDHLVELADPAPRHGDPEPTAP